MSNRWRAWATKRCSPASNSTLLPASGSSPSKGPTSSVQTPARSRSRKKSWAHSPRSNDAITRRGLVDGHRRGLLDLEQELSVALGVFHLVEQQLQRLLGIEGVQHPAKFPDDLQLFRRHQEFFLAGTGGVNVDRREDALVGELAVELQLHVAGALELLEDHFVAARAGLDQRRREDRQR